MVVATDREIQKRLIVLHPSYPQVQSGQLPANPILFPEGEELELVLRGGTFESYRDPVGHEDPDDTGAWLASSAPVKGTEFVVIVQVKPKE